MQYDLTGANPDFKVTNKRYVVFKPGQKIELHEPAFPNTLVVNKVTETGLAPLSANSDYVINSSNYDNDAISEAKVVDVTFNYNLINSFYMSNAAVPENYEIVVEYQKLRSTLVDDAYYEGIPIEYDSNLMGEVVTTLRYLEMLASRETHISENYNVPTPLDEDLTGVKPENQITDEVHSINTAEGIKVLRPLHGAFYAHDVVIKLAADPTTVLQEGTDYMIIGADLPKTRVCDHPSGVFNYVYFTGSLAADVTIDYRAFGGEFTSTDLSAIRDALLRILQFLYSGNFVTTSALPYHPYVKTLNRRIVELEDYLRGLDSSIPNIEMILNPGNEYFHWYTFATMHHRDGDNPPGYVYYKNNGKFRLKLKELGAEIDFGIAVNKENQYEPFDVNIVQTNVRNEGVSDLDYSGLADNIIPRIRMITSSDMNSGITLQFGVALRGIASEHVIIENHSGKEVEWMLYDYSSPTAPPADDNVVLPNGTTVWQSGHPNMQEYDSVLGSDDGVMIWAGGLLFNDIRYPEHTSLMTSLMHDDVRASDITSLGFKFLDRAHGNVSTVFSDQDSYPPQFAAVINQLDFVGLAATVFDSPTGVVGVDITATQGMHSSANNRYCLLQLYAKFNKGM